MSVSNDRNMCVGGGGDAFFFFSFLFSTSIAADVEVLHLRPQKPLAY